MQLHYLQEQILKKLIGTKERALYSELRIQNIENDLFNYHLQKLVKLKLVDKTDDGYSLSLEGKRVTEDINPLGVIRDKADTFKLYSHGIVMNNSNGTLEILNRRRTKQPFFGDKGILGESVKKGQDVKSALSDRLLSQTGIIVDPTDMKLAGVIRKITYDQKGELFSDFIFYIFFCLKFNGELDQSLDNNNVFWVSIDEAIQNEEHSQHPFPSLVKILKTLKNDPTLASYIPLIEEDIVNITI